MNIEEDNNPNLINFKKNKGNSYLPLNKNKNKNTLMEVISFEDNKDNNIKEIGLSNLTYLPKDELLKNINSSIDIDKENNINKLNNAINSINIKLDSSKKNINNEVNIKINRKNKMNTFSDLENNSILSYKYYNNKKPLFSKSLSKEENSLDNKKINRKVYLCSYRNKPKLKIITGNNTYTNQSVNLNIYDSIKQNQNTYFSSLKSNSLTTKIKSFSSLNNAHKPSKIKIKKRYNSLQHYSPKNESLKVNKKIYTTVANNNNIKIKKSFSLKKNQKLNNLQNNSFINYNSISNRNIMSSKEKIIEEKLKVLNDETLKFREERNKVNELKKEYEKLQDKLFKDIDDFTKKKEEFEKFKQNEINNINKERKNMLLDSKLMINSQNQNKSLELEIKKNEETIAQLKMQINELQLIIKNKDTEIKNLKNIINERNVYRKTHTLSKLKEIKIDDNNKNIYSLDKKNNSFKILNDNEKINDIYNSNTFKFKKLNIVKNNKNNSSISNNSSILGQKNSCRLFKKIKSNKDNKIKDFYSSHAMNEDTSKLNFSNSNLLNNKSSIIFNPTINRNDNHDIISCNKIYLKSESNNNFNINYKNNNTKIETIKSIKSTYIINNNNINYTLKNYQNKTIANNNKFANPIQCKLKKNLKNTIKIKNEFMNKKLNQKLYNINTSYSKSDIDKKNNSIVQNKNKNNEQNNFKEQNNNYDFIIPEKYMQIDMKNNKISKLLNMNGNNVAFYSNNKKEITYPDGMKHIIYDDNHQIIYYNNGDMKQIFNNGKVVYYNNSEQKVETLYENGIKIVKYKNGEMERFLCDDKENINTNNNFDFNSNSSIINNCDKNNELNKKIEKKCIYNNKYKTIQK